MKNETVKMTLEDYEKKHSSKVSQKKAGRVVKIFILTLGIVITACVFLVFKEVYELNKYAGYVVAVLGAVFIIVCYVVPVVKISKLEKFSIDVTGYNAGRARRKNARIRKALSEKIVDCYVATEDGSTWYSDQRIKAIVDARNNYDDEALKKALQDIYTTDVKKSAHKIVKRCAVRSGTYSALSQNDKLDTAIVGAVNLQMVKDLLYLYGFRPTELELMRVFGAVLRASLVSYGMGTLSGNVGNAVGGMVKAIPILGAVVGTLVDSSVQGIVNGTVTAIIGFKTIKYLMRDFNLQNVLDSVEVDVTEEDFKLTCALIKDELVKEKKPKAFKGEKAKPQAI